MKNVRSTQYDNSHFIARSFQDAGENMWYLISHTKIYHELIFLPVPPLSPNCDPPPLSCETTWGDSALLGTSDRWVWIWDTSTIIAVIVSQNEMNRILSIRFVWTSFQHTRGYCIMSHKYKEAYFVVGTCTHSKGFKKQKQHFNIFFFSWQKDFLFFFSSIVLQRRIHLVTKASEILYFLISSSHKIPLLSYPHFKPCWLL